MLQVNSLLGVEEIPLLHSDMEEFLRSAGLAHQEAPLAPVLRAFDHHLTIIPGLPGSVPDIRFPESAQRRSGGVGGSTAGLGSQEHACRFYFYI